MMHRAFRLAARRSGPSRRARLQATALAAALTVGLAGCDLLTGGPGQPPGSGASQGPPAPTRPAAMAPEAYRAELAAAVKEARAALDAVGAAKKYGQLLDRSEKAESVVGGVAVQLGMLANPPDAVVEEHAELVAGLEELTSELDGVTEAIAGRELCAASATMARMGKLDAVGRVRAAAKALDAAAGEALGAGGILPKPVKETNRRLANGTILTDRRQGGLGELRVDNRGSKQDAVVTLVQGKRVVVSVYVARDSRRTLTRIADGSYQVLQTSGVDWDRRLRTFTRDCSFMRFDDSLRFTTTSRAATSWSISFRPVKDGNAKISDLDPDKFPRS
jgi:hypothetical protein